MKPAPFEYQRAGSLAEALEQIAANQDDGKVIAGGQSLIPLLNLRLARPSVLIDVNRVGLDQMRQQDGRLLLGATVRHAVLERDPLVRRTAPLLAAAARLIGHPAIRNRGTVGGSLAHADPAAELCAAALALDAEVEAASVRGTRTVHARDLWLGPFVTSLDADELLTAVRVPAHGDHGCAFEEVAMRSGDFAFVGVAAAVRRDAAGAVDSARLVIAGTDGVPLRAAAAEAALLGGPPTGERLDRAAAAAAAATNPHDDVHASADYRRHLAAVLTRRAVQAALRREPNRDGRG